MRCEVCGREINSNPYKVMIEGAKLTVCIECSKHGKIFYEEPKPKTTMIPRFKAAPVTLRIQPKKTLTPPVDTSFELVEDFAAKIRQAREELGLSHEDMGKKINEKVSLLRKIETGKIAPDDKLAAALEHTLKVKLIVPTKEGRVPQARITKVTSRELTLGDLIQLHKSGKEKEGKTGRKQS